MSERASTVARYVNIYRGARDEFVPGHLHAQESAAVSLARKNSKYHVTTLRIEFSVTEDSQ